MKNSNFVHLRVHSDYSIQDGLASPIELIKYAAKLNMVSLGLTDINNLYGVIKFYSSACNLGIKPIIGIDITVKSYLLENDISKLTLLAANNVGYNNILQLISNAYIRGYKENIGPIVDLEQLVYFKEGIIILSGGMEGEIGKCLLNYNNLNLLKKCINFYKKNFFNYYYLEISRIGKTLEPYYIDKIKEISIKYTLPIVATNPVSFLQKEDYKAHKIRVAIYQKKKIKDIKFLYTYTKHQFLKSSCEMNDIFFDIPSSLINTFELSKRCNVIIPTGKFFFPNFPIEKDKIEKFFINKVKIGLNHRLQKIYPHKKLSDNQFYKYNIRLQYEINIVKDMDFIGYFLIVMEFINWAKDRNIPVGPGRGSGAGSLIAYALGITELDPIKFDLLFERFLNPDRISLPDFDIDFCMEKRDIVIDHVSKKYGRNFVAQIITFGTMTAKAVIRDVGRVLGYPYNLINKISKLIPLDPKMTLKKALLMQPELIDWCQKDHNIQKLINISKKLEGVIRNIGKHAGGVVIAPTQIANFVPIFCDPNGTNQMTQFDKNDIEFVGLVKFDFLGLKTLTMIDICLKLINKKRRKRTLKLIEINNINLKDKKSFSLLQSANTTAVFQLESLGMRNLIRRLKPDSFKDIIALVALYRPGPLQSGMVDNFINRKHKKEKISYPDMKWQHKLLRPILEETYGIILYQEQVMKIAQILANYSPGNADILRRAMGKKDPIEMKNQRKNFILGAKNNGICSILAKKIFDLLEKFSAYGFNKSHSATYALLSFQTLWLKAHYPEEFMASAMTLEMTNTDKIFRLVQDIRLMQLKIIPPNINLSKYGFYVNSEKLIVYGLGAIKGVGKSSIEFILDNRKKHSIFKSFLDLCIRIPSKYLTRRILERLVMSGACDCFNIPRMRLFNSIKNVIKIAKQYVEFVVSKQQDFFHFDSNFLNNNLFNMTCYETNKEKTSYIYSNQYAIWEMETLGFYLEYHPIKNFLRELAYYTKRIKLSNLYNYPIKKKVFVAGLVLSIKTVFTKKKKKMYLMKIDDWSSDFYVVFFPVNIKDENYLLKQKDSILIVEGFLSYNHFSNNLRILGKKITNIEEFRIQRLNKIKLYLNELFLSSLEKIHNLLHFFLNNINKGTVLIDFIFPKHTKIIHHKLFHTIWKVYPSNIFLNSLKNFSKYFKIMFNYK